MMHNQECAVALDVVVGVVFVFGIFVVVVFVVLVVALSLGGKGVVCFEWFGVQGVVEGVVVVAELLVLAFEL